MLTTFPHMGYYWVCFKSLFENLGFDILLPPKITKKTIESGVKNSPETVCLPFKVTLGSMIESLDKGAEAIAMVSSNGPCRLGEYSRIQESILKGMGYKFRMITVKQNQVQYKKSKLELYNELKGLLRINNKKFYDLFKAVLVFYSKLRLIDKFADIRNFNRAYEIQKGTSEKIFNNFLGELDSTNKFSDFLRFSRIYKKKFKFVEKTKKNNLKLALVGEIYVSSEPSLNFDIEKMIGEMGIEIYHFSNLYAWTHPLRAIKLVRQLRGESGNCYLNYPVGGEGIKTITYIKKAAKKGYDGVIHLYPFTCMPEVTIKALIPKISKDYKIPVISLNIDEQTGKAGFQTRIEAFIDMIRNKKD